METKVDGDRALSMFLMIYIATQFDDKVFLYIRDPQILSVQYT